MRLYSTSSCTEQCSIPFEYTCMWSEVLQGYCKLYNRYDKIVTKKPKILQLAEPRHRTPKYRSECKCMAKPKFDIEIIDKTDKMESTRLEQLSYPKLRQLNCLKSHSSFSSFSTVRKSSVNRMIRKSLLSVYSRLQNIQMEEKPPPAKLFGSENKAKQMSRLRVLAKPRQPPKPREGRKSRARGMPQKFKRIRKLSKPRKYKESPPNIWTLTDALKNYQPTERLKKIAQPRTFRHYDEEEEAMRKKQNALKYRASRRIRALAEPSKAKFKEVEEDISIFQPNMRALKAVASKRVKELAKPREASDMNTKGDAFKVSRSALKAKASPRVQKLATPKAIKTSFN